MVRTARLRLVAALLGGMLAASAVMAQAPMADPAKLPAATPVDAVPGLPRPPDAPASLMLAGPTVGGDEIVPCPYFERDPLPDGPPMLSPGWFAAVELDPTGSHVKNDLSNATIPGNTLPVFHIPSAPLNWTIAPRIELGYRLPSGFGGFVLGFRFLDTDGNGTAQGPDTLAALHSRLDLNIADFDYVSDEISLMPDVLCHRWDMQWRVGIRYAYVFFDSQIVEPFAVAAAGSGIVEQRNSDRWDGVGPHVGLQLGRHFGNSGLSFVGKTDFFLGLGRIRQGFYDVGTTPATTAQLNVNRSQTVPVLNLQAGFGWSRPDITRLTLFVGYQYEYWWNIGRESDTTPPDQSNGSMWDQGLVVRIGWNF